jgi:hypothetical protein
MGRTARPTPAAVENLRSTRAHRTTEARAHTVIQTASAKRSRVLTAVTEHWTLLMSSATTVRLTRTLPAFRPMATRARTATRLV